jgi:hypothetical protein
MESHMGNPNLTKGSAFAKVFAQLGRTTKALLKEKEKARRRKGLKK